MSLLLFRDNQMPFIFGGENSFSPKKMASFTQNTEVHGENWS
jgi:hypothetical protein